MLLLEAGGRDWHPFYHLPAGFAKMTKGIGSWGWSTVPQRHMNNMVIRYTQAKVIGGGSSINAQIYTRGNALDYDDWRQMGCEGWSYEDVLPYFRKAEDNDSFDNRYHGKGGPLGVSKPSAPLPICEAYFKAAAELGIPFNGDMTGETQDGVGYYQLTQRNVRRSSASIAYLNPARKRPNLTIRTDAQVLKLVVENGRAVGVELAGEGVVRAEREVLLSSGAIGSPRLLMLSGIGPADHLPRSVCPSSSTSRASVPICRTISISSSSPNAPGRTPMTASPSRISRCWPACNTADQERPCRLEPF